MQSGAKLPAKGQVGPLQFPRRNLLRILLALSVIAIAAVPALDSAVAKKAAVYQCNDGIDNDRDGHTDYGDDSACWAPYVDTEVPECSDGVDNDGNGDIDYPADEACLSAEQPVEQDTPSPVCDDGYDNDLDGKIDYPADRGCSSVFDSTETGGRKPPT